MPRFARLRPRTCLLLRPWLGAALLLAAAACVAAPHALPVEVEAALAQAKLPREALSILVEDVGSGLPRLSWQPERPVNPASLMKLVTTDAALELLGPAFTWSTPVWLAGPLRDGVLDGDLVIKGSGDPKLVVERVWLMLRRVRDLGVREIRGDIVLDRSAFNVPDQDPAEFDGESLRPYNVRPDALLLNYKSQVFTFTPDAGRGIARVSMLPALAGVAADTSVPLSAALCDDWRTALKADLGQPAAAHFAGVFPAACGEKQWPVAYADPKSYNERLLGALWREVGGTLAGVVRDGRAPSTAPSFELASPPLAEVVRDINKFSNNVMAQQLFLTLGLVLRGQGAPEAARDVLRRWIDERLGSAGAGAVIDNGSGLSRETRVTARLLARLLQNAWASPVMSELMSTLPVSGVDGTLRRSRAPAGRAHLKTCSLRDVAGIAGYVLSATGRRYVVVAIANHPNAAAARPALDALVQWVTENARPAAHPTE